VDNSGYVSLSKFMSGYVSWGQDNSGQFRLYQIS